MIDPTSAHIVLSAALAITLGLLVRVLCVRRVPTIRSVIQAERKHVVRVCKQALNESSLLTPDVLERLEVAAAREEAGQSRKPGRSRLRATARDCIRAQLIKALFDPSGLSSDGGASVLADVLDQLQPSSATPLALDGQSMERAASRRLLEGAINRYINTCDATQTLATVLDIVGNHSFDYSQLVDTNDEADVTLDFEWK